MPTVYQYYLAMRNTTDVTGGKSIAVWSQSISGVNAINLLFAFYDITCIHTLTFYLSLKGKLTFQIFLHDAHISKEKKEKHVIKKMIDMNVEGWRRRGRPKKQ
jgi:hypothetical protein